MTTDPDRPEGPITIEMAIEAIREVLRSSERAHVPVTPTSGFEELGLSSLDVGEVFVVLEELCGIPLEPLSLESLATVADLVLLRPADDVPVGTSDEP